MILENSRLRVRFADAQEMKNQRFDHTAMVAQVVLDGRHTFCTPEQVIPARRTSHGFGLCGEFVLAGAAESASAGEWFAKPGVGLLRQIQDGLPYDMWKTYDCRPYAVSVSAQADRLVCTQRAEPCGGYGVNIRKTFSLRDNRLILGIEAENIGEKDCGLQEYQHNFVSLRGQPVGEGYALELACDGALAQLEGQTLRQGDEARLPSAVRVQGTRVLWQSDMNEKILYHRSEEIIAQPPYGWTLSCAGASVSEETDFCPSRIDIWSVEHCVCPELYFSARLAPGQTARWRRIWTFEA